MSKNTQTNTIEIIEKIQLKQFNPHNLHKKDRLQLVAFLRNEGKSQYEIARFLGFNDKTIWRDCKAIQKNAAQLVKEITIEKVAGDLIREANILIDKAKKKQDFDLAWKIKCDLIEKLQSMGFVHKVAEKVKHGGEIEHKHFFQEIIRKSQEANFSRN